jgi:hypothetical protein
MLPPSSGLKCLKDGGRVYLPTSPHGITTQKNINFLAAVETSTLIEMPLTFRPRKEGGKKKEEIQDGEVIRLPLFPIPTEISVVFLCNSCNSVTLW